MGRSGASCFRIIACAGDTVDRDDFQTHENKSSNGKCGWSFRGRSTKHRVLSNTVVSEATSGSKERAEANVEFQAETSPPLPVKESVVQWAEEKIPLPLSGELKFSETVAAKEGDCKDDFGPDESIIIIIQSGIRGFLAQRAFMKHKNVVKLQAAVRGHLVRNHALGTLRCAQAIVKMQALVRARRAQMNGTNIDDKLREKHGDDNYKSNLLGLNNTGGEAPVTHTSIEKLLSNRLARQHLESKRTKAIKIKCDPSKSDSSWKWLERWMSISSKESGQPQNIVAPTDQPGPEKNELPEVQAETILSSDGSESVDMKSSNGEAAVPSEGEDNLITYEAENFDFEAPLPISSSGSYNLEQPQPENIKMSASKETGQDLRPDVTNQSDSTSKTEPCHILDKPIVESEQHLHTMKEAFSEPPDVEGKKAVIGSRRASNPAFLAAQSKFVELSSTTHSVRSNSSRDTGVESHTNTVEPLTKSVVKAQESGPSEDSVSYSLGIRAGSECGTELSITSTLDSPDRYETGVLEFDKATSSLEKSSNPNINGNRDFEANSESTIVGTELSCSIPVQPEESNDLNCENGKSEKPVVSFDFLNGEQQPKKNASDTQIELEPMVLQQTYKSSPEASPRSHMTIPESQGTPSSQISVKPKKTDGGKTGSNQKRRSLSAGKRSPSNPNRDSGATNSPEQLPKDHTPGKRRNSCGSTRPDNVDREPRDSTSSNSIPNYMQATESARAKALANSSPRPSPDVNEKDLKRHSLPGDNGRQGSPRIQRTSQAQQGAKKSERKWQR